MQTICVCIPTLTWNTHRKTIHTRRNNKSNSYVLKHTPQWRCKIKSNTYILYITKSIISKCHSFWINQDFVCLLTSRRSGRRRLSPAVSPVGCHRDSATCREEGRHNSQTYTGRHRSAFACVSVRVRACQCACVLTSSNNHVNRAQTPEQSEKSNARNMHLTLYGHTLHTEKA